MMPERMPEPINWDAEPDPQTWQWRKCRNAGITIQLWPIEWAFGKHVTADEYCWVGTLHAGPFVFQLNCNVGRL